MIETFAIPLTFLIVTALTLWVVIGSKGWWWAKAAVVIVTVAFSITLWQSLDGIQGWPSSDKLPAKFEIKWIFVLEPNQKTKAAGAIYVLAQDIEPEKSQHSWYLNLKHKDLSQEPRIYKTPYSRAMHEQSIKIQSRIKQGGRFFAQSNKEGVGGDGDGDGDGEEGDGDAGSGKGGKGKGKGKKGKGRGQGGVSGMSGGGMTENAEDFMLYELPPPSYPQKWSDDSDQ